MLHTVEWKVRLYLSDDEGTTRARVVVNTGTTTLTGHGAARCNPADSDVPEIGDELAAGRAMHDLGRQLVSTAERDIKGLGTPAGERSARPVAGWLV
ncbi:dsRBD fold-containing protein [Streptomyces sp. NPDC059697]|uniref:dsRBD fold-containing protein n=1 Tax=Streptomyces sp. NPDC059697 TaxID=3346912 RepID=UPI0036AF3E45